MEIIITNDQKRISLNLKNLKKLALGAAGILRLPADSMLTVNFVSNQKIRALNKKYFNKNCATDVIALGYKSSKERAVAGNYLGDVIIAPSVAKENAKIYDLPVSSEILLYMVHGILHLLGYTDTNKNARGKMQKKQEDLLRLL